MCTGEEKEDLFSLMVAHFPTTIYLAYLSPAHQPPPQGQGVSLHLQPWSYN